MNLLSDTVYLYRHPTDMRKQIDGLVSIVASQMQLDPMSCASFVFISRGGDKIKIIRYETNGFWLLYKRLIRQRFKWPKRWFTDDVLQLDVDSFVFLLQGCDLNGLQKFHEFKPQYAC